MKTSIDIDDALLDRVRRRARREGVTIKQLVESGLRLALRESAVRQPPKPFVWPVASGMKAQPLINQSVNEMIDAMRDERLNRIQDS